MTSHLTFDQEFTGSTLDVFRPIPAWKPGFGRDSDFMGDLRQVSVAKGMCTITAQRMATPSGRPFASGIFTTDGTFAQAYGTWVARIRYPKGNGVWPAFWLLRAGDPPAVASNNPIEIDIMEAYPHTRKIGWAGPDYVESTLLYTEGSSARHQVGRHTGIDLTSGFHTFRLHWTKRKLTFSVGSTVIGEITENVPTEPMFMLLNLAIGQTDDRADDSTPDTAAMDIAWVRVYAP